MTTSRKFIYFSSSSLLPSLSMLENFSSLFGSFTFHHHLHSSQLPSHCQGKTPNFNGLFPFALAICLVADIKLALYPYPSHPCTSVNKENLYYMKWVVKVIQEFKWIVNYIRKAFCLLRNRKFSFDRIWPIFAGKFDTHYVILCYRSLSA